MIFIFYTVASHLRAKLLVKVSTFSPKVTENKLKFWCNKKFPSATLNPIAAFNLEQLLSARLQYKMLIQKFFGSIVIRPTQRDFDNCQSSNKNPPCKLLH